MIKMIDAITFKLMLINGFYNLDNNFELVNDLNVFPVADGDTGTNMKLTLNSGYETICSLSTNKIKEVAKAMAKGCLMGARGNSGVILSQYFKGLSNALVTKEDPYITVNDLKRIFEEGSKFAYKSVQTPVEGTILTVINDAYLAVRDLNLSEYELFKAYYNAAKKSLDNTPNLLPVLKESGVVDSGGFGFLLVLEGMLKALEGITLELNKKIEHSIQNISYVNSDIKYAYCTEFILTTIKDINDSEYITKTQGYGDSLIFVHDEDVIKVHIHTNNPGSVISLYEDLGEFKTLKIENMRHQHSMLIKSEVKNFSIIAVVDGNGIEKTYRDLGVDYFIYGGQTMNPAINDFIKAIESVDSDNIIILPNNKNVILAANQALENSLKNVKVLKTNNMAEGYALLLELEKEASFYDNYNKMKTLLDNINTFEITTAVKNTIYKGKEIKKGDIISLSNGNILHATNKLLDTVSLSLDSLINEDTEIITFFTGDSITFEDVDNLEKLITSKYPEISCDFIKGDQHIYSLLAVIE